MIEGRMWLIPSLQNTNHLEMYEIYCLFVEFLHDLRMKSLACFGIPLSLSAFLICENTQNSPSLVDVVFPFCAEGTLSFVDLEGGTIGLLQDVTGLATSFVWPTEGQVVLLWSHLLLPSEGCMVASWKGENEEKFILPGHGEIIYSQCILVCLRATSKFLPICDLFEMQTDKQLTQDI